MLQPFEVPVEELADHLDECVDAVYSGLESAFLTLPRGPNFVDYPRFQEAYECLKMETHGFSVLEPGAVWAALNRDGLAFLVLRAILGLSAPELASLASTETPVLVLQGAARSLEQKLRSTPGFVSAQRPDGKTIARIGAMIDVACRYLAVGAPPGAADTVHRLDKADTAEGLRSLRRMASSDVPYAVLLYERVLGRPFASHRDAVSELMGEVMEGAVRSRLENAGITYRQTRRAERISDFDQAPDFFVPDEFAPKVVIEAKLASDDGTARDKFTRIIHLVELSKQREAAGRSGFEVIACIDGRGFGVRREDMRRLILNVGGKVFTLRTLDRLISTTRLSRYATVLPDEKPTFAADIDSLGSRAEGETHGN